MLLCVHKSQLNDAHTHTITSAQSVGWAQGRLAMSHVQTFESTFLKHGGEGLGAQHFFVMAVVLQGETAGSSGV